MEGLFILIVAVLVISLLAALIKKLLPSLKGKYGEELVKRELEKKLPQFRYSLLHDVTLPTGSGTTQIDHLVLSSHGVFVIETKNMSGWIFGSEHQSSWTQTFHSKKTSFQNPLRQNYDHVKVLQELFGLKGDALFSIIVFAGSARFKTPMPENVVNLKGLVPFILGKANEAIPPADLPRLIDLIEAGRLAPGAATDAAHVQSLKQRHGQAKGVLDGISSVVTGSRTTLKYANWAIGVALIAVLLVAGTFIIRNVADVLRPDPLVSQPVSAHAQPGETVQNPAETTSIQSSLGSLFTRNLLSNSNADALTRKQELELQKQQAWEASLMCAYSEDTHRCACYEPKGGRANIEHEQCVMLAQRGSVLTQ